MSPTPPDKMLRRKVLGNDEFENPRTSTFFDFDPSGVEDHY
jgi:hypothetical protein